MKTYKKNTLKAFLFLILNANFIYLSYVLQLR